jgi:hypothetical protein
MAISVACPSCERELKLKEELAGRKIKCPGCGEPILVPDADEEADDERPAKKNRPHADNGVAAGAPKKRPPAPTEDDDEEAAPRKKRPARDEEDEPEDRPRKKKKKKKNQTVLIAVVAGVALLAFCLIGSVASYFLFINKGDKKGGEQAKSTEQPKIPDQPKGGGPGPKGDKRPKGGIPRGMDIHEVKNMFKQIGLAYHSYVDANNRKGPPNYQALSPFYERVKSYDDALKDDGFIVFIWNVAPQQMTNGTSQTILAYERDMDDRGARVVLFGDGSVDVLGEETFQAATKAQPKK